MNAKILVADDESGIRKMMAHALEARHFTVEHADRGDLAFDMACVEDYDLIMLDVSMPGMDGVEVLRRLRENAQTHLVPVIMVTGMGGEDNEVSSLGFGADDYVTKPFSMAELLARVERLLKRAAEDLSASPLTRLPGSPTLEDAVRARVANAEDFALLYMDIDRFKSFNDAYGFEKGDRLLKRFAALLAETTAEFAGLRGLAAHIGGDDFAALCPSDRAAELAHRLACGFDAEVPSFYNSADRTRGYVETLDRQKRLGRSPFVTIRIGVATTAARPLTCYAQAAAIASELKNMLKTKGGTLSRFAVDRRAS
ncbi:MAG: response regulator [Elusimicrobia bacterium]|nr:response regulator [Elusimicrobiota bacterium]